MSESNVVGCVPGLEGKAICRKYTAVSLFSGAMGLDIGLEQTGRFEVLACVEKDESAVKTIEANVEAGNMLNPDLRIYGDIRDVSPQRLLGDLGIGEVDVVIGGPPCQSFSTAGRRGTIQDPRGALIWDFFRFVEGMRPKFFLMENVRGLLSAAVRHRPIAERDIDPLSKDEQPGSVVRLLLADYERIGYRADVFEVNAVNYGAPQLRERVFFIGNKFGLVSEFPKPTHASRGECRKRAKQSRLEESAAVVSPYRTLREALAGIDDPHPLVMDFSPRKKSFLALVPPGSNWRALPAEKQKESMGKAYYAKGGRSGWWRKLTYDLPCPCLLTMPNHASTALCHPDELRALSVREYARIQEFPDEWVFVGDTPDLYRQIGNAVPVRLGRIAGEVVAVGLDRVYAKHLKGGVVQDIIPHSKVTYLKSHVRTKRWYHNGEPVINGEEY